MKNIEVNNQTMYHDANKVEVLGFNLRKVSEICSFETSMRYELKETTNFLVQVSLLWHFT